MSDPEHNPPLAHLPALECHARFVLALESALLSHRVHPSRLDAVINECVSDLRHQELTEEETVGTMRELVTSIASALGSCFPCDAGEVVDKVAARTAEAYRRLDTDDVEENSGE